MDCGLDYSKTEGLFSKSAGTAGSKIKNPRGSLENKSGERIPTDLDRRI